MYENLLSLMGMMFILIVAGFILRKRNIIRAEGKPTLVDLVLNLILPCNILNAFLKEYTPEFWQMFWQLVIVGLIAQGACLLVAYTCYHRMPDNVRAAYQYGTVCSNGGFMGNPVVEGVFGTAGLLYASVIILPQRVSMWTAGVSFFQKSGGSKTRAYLKVLVNPAMIATYIGFFIMATGITFPSVITRTVSSCSNCCTAMTMVYIGCVLADADLHGVFTFQQIYFAILRLLVIPAAVYGICRLFGFDTLAAGVACLIVAMPSGSTGPILAAKYGGDAESAAKSVVFTTALSIITIPLWSAFLLSQI